MHLCTTTETKEKTTMTTETLKNKLAKGDKTIGALVYWRRLEGVRILRPDFRAGFAGIGLAKAVKKDPKPEACLNQAASAASKRQGDGNAIKIELKAKGEWAIYAVLVRRDTDDGRRRYIEEARCSIERGVRSPPPPMVVTMDPAALPSDARDAVIADFDARYQELLAYALTLELSTALIAAMDLMGALPLRTGVYFVPAANVAQARRLKAFVESQTDVQLTVWDIAGSDGNADEARRDAREAFTDRFKALVSEVESFVAEIPEGEAAPAVTMTACLTRFRELEGHAILFGDILGDYRDELAAKMAKAKTALLGAYLGDEA